MEIPVRRRDQTRIGAQRTRAADALELLLLQHAKDLRLCFERQFADLVQKQSPAVGKLETPATLLRCTGERAFFVTEQLAFHELARQCSAVYFYERPVTSRASVMNRAGDQLFPGARFAEDQDGAIGRRTKATWSSSSVKHGDRPTISWKLCPARISSSR